MILLLKLIIIAHISACIFIFIASINIIPIFVIMKNPSIINKKK